MLSTPTTDTPCCSQDLPVELRSVVATLGNRSERPLARLLNGLPACERDDELVRQDLLEQNLMIQALGHTTLSRPEAAR